MWVASPINVYVFFYLFLSTIDHTRGRSSYHLTVPFKLQWNYQSINQSGRERREKEERKVTSPAAVIRVRRGGEIEQPPALKNAGHSLANWMETTILSHRNKQHSIHKHNNRAKITIRKGKERKTKQKLFVMSEEPIFVLTTLYHLYHFGL